MFLITLCALLVAKDNRTLLGTDFLHSVGIVLDLINHNWYYHDNPEQKFRFHSDIFKSTVCMENATEVNAFL